MPSIIERSGKYLYQVTLQTTNYLQLGWATPSFVAKPDMGRGCGDDEEGRSWGYNVNGMELRHARVGQIVEREDSCKVGDVIGLGIDIDLRVIYIFINDVAVYQSDPYQRIFPRWCVPYSFSCKG